MKLIDLSLLYSVQVAYATEAWRREHGSAVRRWLEVIGKVEALLTSVSAYLDKRLKTERKPAA